MKKFIVFILFFIFQINIFAVDSSTPGGTFFWDAKIYKDAKYLEFILDLRGSLLTENLKKYTERIRSYPNGIYSIKNIQVNEEKIALKLENTKGDIIYFTNFDSSSQYNSITKRFHNVELIKHNGRLKAKVGIYVHKDLDKDVAKILLTNDEKGNDIDNENYDTRTSELNMKNAFYVYYGPENKKIGKIIKIN